METSFYFMYLCSKVNSAVWYLCHKTPLRIEVKSPRIEFSLKFLRSWLAEYSPIVLCLLYHSWLLGERFLFYSDFYHRGKMGGCVNVWICVCVFSCMRCFASSSSDFYTSAHLNQVYYVKLFKTLKCKGLCKCKIYSLTINWCRPMSEPALLQECSLPGLLGMMHPK